MINYVKEFKMEKPHSKTYLFKQCFDGFTSIRGVDFKILADGEHLYIFFEGSRQRRDWFLNFLFPATPYKNMDAQETWKAHRGFVKAFKTIDDILKPVIIDKHWSHITIVGYSHGGALAMLCHEFCWYHRQDIKSRIHTYAFGAPRVLYGRPRNGVLSRWANFKMYRNMKDIVTHVPPSILGFTHVGKVVKIQDATNDVIVEKWGPIDSHRPENYISAMEARRL